MVSKPGARTILSPLWPARGAAASLPEADSARSADQRYLHPDVYKITAAGTALTTHLTALRAPRTQPSRIAITR
ncbi:hypothetical protein ACIQU5_31440 [Streptomyces sp. NPDC090306]|uniref:hypothetical protein n=1 Tax=Streptomyces sp. NPDC090306 TaxID=3365961 RepID=UPI0037FCC815